MRVSKSAECCTDFKAVEHVAKIFTRKNLQAQTFAKVIKVVLVHTSIGLNHLVEKTLLYNVQIILHKVTGVHPCAFNCRACALGCSDFDFFFTF